MSFDGRAKPEQPLRPIELLRELSAHRAEFVVIGGYSLAAHGYIRGTKDVAGYDDLIALKQTAGRPQDLLDIAELERRRHARRDRQ